MEISIHFGAVLVAAVAQFIVGAIWYMPLFGRLWGKIHGFDEYDEATQKVMQKQMLPLLALQFVLGFLTAYVLAHLITLVDSTSYYKFAFLIWLGFMMPVQVAAVIFGGTKPRWIVTKSAIMAGGSLACVMVAAWILQAIG